MLLDNYVATLYPKSKIISTDGATDNGQSFTESQIGSIPSSEYSESRGNRYFNPFRRGIAFGSGTTPPQKTDYKLENYIASGLTYSGNNTNQTDRVVNWVQTVQNTSTEQITITEVGLFSKYTSSQSYAVTLLTRTVLDTPVVLQPNEVKTFTITNL